MFHAPIPGSSRPELSHNANVVAGDLLEGNRHKPGYRSALSVTVTNSPILRGADVWLTMVKPPGTRISLLLNANRQRA